MSAADEVARAEAELQWPNGSNPWHTTRRHGFERGAAWQRSQPVDVTEAMVEAAVRAWEGEGYPKHMGTMLQVALRAALGVVEPKPAPETPELPTTERQS